MAELRRRLRSLQLGGIHSAMVASISREDLRSNHHLAENGDCLTLRLRRETLATMAFESGR